MSDKPPYMPDLSEFLAPDLDEALQSYHAFKQEKFPSDAKEFTAYHNACKSALMHIALLLKLIQTAPSSSVDEESEAPDWIEQAHNALKLKQHSLLNKESQYHEKNDSEQKEIDDLFFD